MALTRALVVDASGTIVYGATSLRGHAKDKSAHGSSGRGRTRAKCRWQAIGEARRYRRRVRRHEEDDVEKRLASLAPPGRMTAWVASTLSGSIGRSVSVLRSARMPSRNIVR